MTGRQTACALTGLAAGGLAKASAWLDSPTGRRLTNAVCVAVCAVILAVAARMALVSAFNAHPDEKDHVSAGAYYMHYWDPPRVGDERTLGAYSNYGISYLHQLDAVYFFAGKFARLLQPLAGEPYMALRLFNLSLLAVLLGLFLQLAPRWRLAFLPLVISPQIWYIFSYFNGDAFPLFCSFVCVRLLVRILDQPRAPSRPLGPTLAGLGLALGLVAISKQNYYVFVAFFLCLLGVTRIWDRAGDILSWRQIAAVLLVAGAIFGVRLAAHQLVEVDQPPDAVSRLAEKLATEEFKPSKQISGEAYWGLNMRSRGVTITEMFTKRWAWHIFTFRTAFGVYDYMKIPAPLIFYRYIGWLLWGLVGVLAAGLALSGRKGRVVLLILAAFSLATIFQSFWHSWTADFQAQGRYLFPILGMFGCTLAVCRDELDRARPLLWLPGLGMWALSLWSFVCVGLAQIQR